MTDDDWQSILAALRQETDVERMVTAVKRLESEATAVDVPRLRALLSDSSFVMREAAALPFAYLLGPNALPDLLVAEVRGMEEGHDNDTLDAAIREAIAIDAERSHAILEALTRNQDGKVAETARGWLQDF